MNLTLTRTTKAALKKLADDKDRSPSSLVRTWISREFERAFGRPLKEAA